MFNHIIIITDNEKNVSFVNQNYKLPLHVLKHPSYYLKKYPRNISKIYLIYYTHGKILFRFTFNKHIQGFSL